MTSEITLNNNKIGFILLELMETSSTNEDAHSIALQGFKDGSVITAKRQTKGRGRRGNRWCSPEGGLYCSIILRPDIAAKDGWIFERLTCIAVWHTIAESINKNPELKPPNDLLFRGKKVAGILIESRGGEERLDYIVAGIGINCSTPLDSFPPDLRARVTTLSHESGMDIHPSGVLKTLMKQMNHWYNLFLSGETPMSLRFSKKDENQLFRHSGEGRNPGFSGETSMNPQFTKKAENTQRGFSDEIRQICDEWERLSLEGASCPA
ncbi:biotin--[acetyl-CoA-carboxylase] ligase [bacterium]|nr:biotin--[acetyl-CoA-carboxylase] ligase [bacterium]